jgi:beta-lactamase superfamily II metal-dependent hydrolase
VQEGQTYNTSVTITFTADRGSYEATLNGQPFASGATVSAPGSYTLIVQARNGAAVATRTIQFTIGGTISSGVTVIRLINLGSNDSGGGGDAILISDSTGTGVHHALVDAGPAGTGGSDFGFVSRRLTALGVDSLDFVMLSHAHGDHYLGLTSVLQRGGVRRFIYNGQVRSLTSYETVISTARSRVGDAGMVVPGAVTSFQLGTGAIASVIPPLPTYIAQDTDDGDRLNEGSLGMQLKRGTFEMFFTGDGEVAANTRWRTTFADFSRDVDVLKVGHHGANNAIFDNGFSGVATWLDHTSPDIAVISANGVTHPRINALNALLTRSNLKTYCTNVHGEIVIRVTGQGAPTVTVEKNANAVCVRGSEATT